MSFVAHVDAWLGEVMRRPAFRVDGSADSTAHATAPRKLSTVGASTMRMSSAALRPSVEILSMLSSSGATRRARTASARSPSSAA